MQKCQLELLPYCSQKFYVSRQKANALIPYVETLLDEIPPVKNPLKAHFVKITKDGKSVNAVISRSFARQDIGRAYNVMAQYGKLCFELLKEN